MTATAPRRKTKPRSDRGVVELSTRGKSTVISGEVDDDTLASLEAALSVREDPGEWLRTCGAIQGKDGQIIEHPHLSLNPFQREVVEIYKYCMEQGIPCRIIILKPRQEGSSTICEAILYTHLRNFVANGLVIAHEHSTTNLLVNMWDRYCKYDGFDWGNTVSKSKRKFSHGSELRLETANDPNAGRGGTLQAIHASEVSLYRTGGKASGEALFESMLNSIHDLPNTLVILESTPNGMEGVYYDTYADAVTFSDFKSGKRGNGYIKVFYPWFAFADTRLSITDVQADAIMSDLDLWEKQLLERWGDQYQITAAHLAWRRDKLTRPPYKHDPSKFNVDYPPDEETCWRTSGSFRFDPEGLNALDAAAFGAENAEHLGELQDKETAPHSKFNIQHSSFTTPPVFIKTTRTEAWLRWWEPPTVGCRYLLAADFMTGEQAAGAKDPDCHAFAVFRDGYVDTSGDWWVPKMVAACLPACRVDIDVACRWIGLMARMYGGCIVVPEINNSNGLVSLLRQHGCNIWHRRKALENTPAGTGKTVRIPGWNTTTQTKPQMVASLAARIREQEWSVPCEMARKENRMFMRWPNGDEKAAPRHHDDWTICQAIASMTLPFATLYDPAEQTQHHRARPAGDAV